VGLFHPVIVVPSWLLTASERARRLVLLHEAEHLRAGVESPALVDGSGVAPLD
jgi:hypothetical protein